MLAWLSCLERGADLVGRQKGHPACKKFEWWGTGMVICLERDADLHNLWPSWCHCHSLSLAPVKSRLVLPFWYRLTQVILEKRPLNGCCITVIRIVLEYCAPVWHYSLTKVQSERLEAVQKHAIHITHNLTHRMPYSPIWIRWLHVQKISLCVFFRDIMDPASCLRSLLPPPRSTAIISMLRSSKILPTVYTRTNCYCSFIQYGLNHYQ